MQKIKWRHASTRPETMANSYAPERAKAIYTDGFLTPYDTPNHQRDALAYRITEAALGIYLIESFIGGPPLGLATTKEGAIFKCEEHLAEWLLKRGLTQEPNARTILTHRLEKARADRDRYALPGSSANTFMIKQNAREIAECEIALAAIEKLEEVA